MTDTSFLDRAYAYYTNLGIPRHQAAALAAHAMAESGGNPTIQEAGGKGPGFGLMQWTTPSRKAGLYKYANDNGLDPNAEATQLGYALAEMQTTEKSAGDKLFAAKDYKEANDAMLDYLRPWGYTAANPAGSRNYAGRYNFGAGLAGVDPIAGGSSPPVGLPPPPTGVSPSADPAVMAGLLAQQRAIQAQAEEDKAQKASQGLISEGMGLLSKGAPQRAPGGFMPAPDVHRPEMQQAGAGAGDFAQLLAQQRLLGRV